LSPLRKLFGIACVQNRVGYLSKVASRYSSRPEMSTNATRHEQNWDRCGTARNLNKFNGMTEVSRYATHYAKAEARLPDLLCAS